MNIFSKKKPLGPSPRKLEIEELELSVFFSRIIRFSSLAEQGGPQMLVKFLHEYLTTMVHVIESHKGTIDKYEANEITAYWGAPGGIAKNALNACTAALDQQKKFDEFKRNWSKRFVWPQGAYIAMGISAGKAVLGPVGDSKRKFYTVTGDPVILASLLLGINNHYETRIIISEAIVPCVSVQFELRELDTIRMPGRERRTTVFELLGYKGELDEKTTKVRGAFAEGLQNYRLRRWERAIENFHAALQVDPDDGPSSKYLDRCRAFIKEPPPDNWDGVFEMKTK